MELNLGAVSDVIVEPKLLDYRTENYRFDRNNDIAGWDEVRTFRVEVRNTRELPVRVEIKRNFNTQYWSIRNRGDLSQFEKEDLDTVKYTVELEPRSERQFEYILRTYHGTRTGDWRGTSG